MATAVAAAIGAGRVVIRISPEYNIHDAVEPGAADVLATYGALMDALATLKLAYLSILHQDPAGGLIQELCTRFGGRCW